MKKLLSIGLIFGLLSLHSFTVQAAETINTPNQGADYLLIALLENEINKAVSDFYKEDNVNAPYYDKKGHVIIRSSKYIYTDYGHGNNKDYIHVYQSEKGNDLKMPYVVKIDITVKKKGILGKDTLYFGIAPKGTLDNSEVKLLDYDHVVPSKK